MTPVRRRFTLSIVLLAVMLPLVAAIAGLVIWQSYRKSVEVAISAGRQQFGSLQVEVALQQYSLLAPVRVAIAALARAPERGPGLISRYARSFITVLEAYPHLAAIRVAFADGTMIEVLPADSSAVIAAAYAIREIEIGPAGAMEKMSYADGQGMEVRRLEPVPAAFDPRTMPWYTAAEAAADRVVDTPPYLILRSDTAGLSAVAAIDGARTGVIAADIALSQFSLPLESLLTEPGQQLFLFTPDQRLFAHADFSKVVDTASKTLTLNPVDTLTLNPVDTLTDAAARALIAEYRVQGEPFSARRMMADSEPFLATVARLGPSEGDAQQLVTFFAFALPETTFTGAFISISQDAVLISLGIIILSIPLIVFIARRLARPLAALAQATDRIAQLDLSAPVSQPTRINEIALLGDSLDRMKSALGQMSKYVPKSLVQDLINSGVSADIGGDRREMSFMFTDVRDFTPMAESMPAEELMSQMSQYFDGLVFEILELDGTVDKYVGDAIFAYWNAPARQDNHPELACLAALACRKTSNRLNDYWTREGRKTWYTRFGVHLGDAVVGNVGSSDRMDYTVVGNAVNIASRLEGLNKFYGTQLLASGQVMDRVPGRFVSRFLDTVSPKGAGLPIRVFEVLGTVDSGPLAADDRERALASAWADVIAKYQRRDWTATAQALAAFSVSFPEDAVAGMMAARVRGFIATPPPGDWDGITRFESK